MREQPLIAGVLDEMLAERMRVTPRRREVDRFAGAGQRQTAHDPRGVAGVHAREG